MIPLLALALTLQASPAAAPPFPATTPKAVLALATQRHSNGKEHADGNVAWTIRNGKQRYTLRIAQRGNQQLIHAHSAGKDFWIGINMIAGVDFTCGRTSGPIVCKNGDPGGQGANAAQAVIQPVSRNFLTRTFSPIAALTLTKASQERQLGRPVSCMAVAAGGQRVKLCSSKTGVLTQMIAGPASVLATSIAPATAADLRPPATITTR